MDGVDQYPPIGDKRHVDQHFENPNHLMDGLMQYYNSHNDHGMEHLNDALRVFWDAIKGVEGTIGKKEISSVMASIMRDPYLTIAYEETELSRQFNVSREYQHIQRVLVKLLDTERY